MQATTVGQKLFANLKTTLISLLQLIMLVIVAFHIGPYLWTAEYYDSKATTIRLDFPIAVIKEGRLSVLYWSQYIKSPERYTAQLYQGADRVEAPSDVEQLKIQHSDNGIFRLRYDTGDYIFWSEYMIQDGAVVPLHFRFNHVMVVLPVLIGLALLMVVLTRLVRWYWRWRIKQKE